MSYVWAMTVVFAGERGNGGLAAQADRPMGGLWMRIEAHGIDDMPTQRFPEPAVFDTSALAELLARRPVPGVDAADLTRDMQVLEGWEVGISEGESQTRSLEAWVMLHGTPASERGARNGTCPRPSLIVTLSGYSALSHTCSGVHIAVAPMQYDEQLGGWDAGNEYPVVSVRESSAPFPPVEEYMALRSLARAVCDVVPLPVLSPASA